MSMLRSLQDLARSGSDEQASRLLIDWTQGGPGGFEQLPRDVQDALHQNAATIGPTFASAPPHVTCDALRRLDRPTLVLNGELTRPFYRAAGKATASCIPGARAARIPGVRHMTIVERPEETAVLMMTFLDER
jgi:pimeloyl-ACP methyl ester carboxylesterase